MWVGPKRAVCFPFGRLPLAHQTVVVLPAGPTGFVIARTVSLGSVTSLAAGTLFHATAIGSLGSSGTLLRMSLRPPVLHHGLAPKTLVIRLVTTGCVGQNPLAMEASQMNVRHGCRL